MKIALSDFAIALDGELGTAVWRAKFKLESVFGMWGARGLCLIFANYFIKTRVFDKNIVKIVDFSIKNH